METSLCLIAAYLIGSISCSIILSKITGQADPRLHGSKNAGATNVLRTQGRKNAVVVLIGDMLKGVITVWGGQLLHLNPHLISWMAFAAILGHVFPIYFGFKGGKGVATALGALLVLQPLACIIAIGCMGRGRIHHSLRILSINQRRNHCHHNHATFHRSGKCAANNMHSLAYYLQTLYKYSAIIPQRRRQN